MLAKQVFFKNSLYVFVFFRFFFSSFFVVCKRSGKKNKSTNKKQKNREGAEKNKVHAQKKTVKNDEKTHQFAPIHTVGKN
jgi:hypothetical protein